MKPRSTSGAKSYYGSAFKNAKQDIALDNGWKLRWAAFTATADGYADGLFVSTANDNATVTNDLTIMHPMVQMGNAPTAWTASSWRLPDYHRNKNRDQADGERN